MNVISNLSHSKRFWTGIIGVFMMLAVEAVPGLENNAAQLQEAILYIVGMLIGGFSLQDTAQAFTTGKTKYDTQSFQARSDE